MTSSPSIVLITGPPGAGKSTVARLLVAESVSPVAYIEGDTFWHFIVNSRPAASEMEARTNNARIVIQAMVASAVRYARGGYETVLDFTIGPWLLKTIHPAIKEVPLDLVVLCPSEAVCATRAASRAEGAMPDYSPYRELHSAFCRLGPFERHAFRSDTASPAELAAQIRERLPRGIYRVEPSK